MFESVIVNDFTKHMASHQMHIITIYDKNTQDFTGQYVARLFTNCKPTKYVMLNDTVEGLREHLPENLLIIPRTIYDDPIILETWLA